MHRQLETNLLAKNSKTCYQTELHVPIYANYDLKLMRLEHKAMAQASANLTVKLHKSNFPLTTKRGRCRSCSMICVHREILIRYTRRLMKSWVRWILMNSWQEKPISKVWQTRCTERQIKLMLNSRWSKK